MLAEGVGRYIGRLSSSLMMDDAGYSSAAVSTAVALGGALILPLPGWIGRLSDRRPRRQVLAGCILVGCAGLVLLSVAEGYWHFLVASACISLMGIAVGAVAPALARDVSAPEAIGRTLGLVNAAALGAGIIGFSVAGMSYQQFGAVATNTIACGVLILGMLALIPLRPGRP